MHAKTKVQIPRRLLAHVRGGHPWIYADAIGRPERSRSGDIVGIECGGRGVGKALYDEHSPIALRVLTTRTDERVGRSLWARRVERAASLRRKIIDASSTDAFRLINGEGDGMPGVHVDHYAGFLVLKLDTPAWLPHLSDLCDALQRVMSPRGIYFKGMAGGRRSGAAADGPAPPEPGVLRGDPPPDPIVVREHGIELVASIQRGQKTGLFLDQRENRALIRRISRGAHVLNLFSYNGGFSIAAAAGGARSVDSVDTAAPALEDARRTFERNADLLVPGVERTSGFHAEDAFAFLEKAAAQDAKRLYDLVICDPPSFAPRKQAVPKAMSAYTALHAAALRVLMPGGLLAAASCSSHIDDDMFLQTLREGAARARRVLRVITQRGAGADHPVPLAFPEGRYLQFVLVVAD